MMSTPFIVGMLLASLGIVFAGLSLCDLNLKNNNRKSAGACGACAIAGIVVAALEVYWLVVR